MLDGTLPLHGGEPGSFTVFFWGIFFTTFALSILGGSVLLILTTDVGIRRASQLVVASFLGYLFLHSLTWVLSGNGPRTTPEATDFFGQRLVGFIIGIVSLGIFAVMMAIMHNGERRMQRVED